MRSREDDGECREDKSKGRSRSGQVRSTGPRAGWLLKRMPDLALVLVERPWVGRGGGGGRDDVMVMGERVGFCVLLPGRFGVNSERE